MMTRYLDWSVLHRLHSLCADVYRYLRHHSAMPATHLLNVCLLLHNIKLCLLCCQTLPVTNRTWELNIRAEVSLENR